MVRALMLAVAMLIPVVAEAGWVADLTWTPSASTKTGTRIERQAGAGAFAVIAPAVSPGTAAFTDAGPLAEGTVYTWRLIEFNAAGDASVVPSATRTPLSLPAGATNLGIQLRFQ